MTKSEIEANIHQIDIWLAAQQKLEDFAPEFSRPEATQKLLGVRAWYESLLGR